MRHDRYVPGTHSGVIKCSVEAVSPIFIGHQKEGEEVVGYRLNGQPAIPASSLRGLISSLAEAASNSAARVLSQRVLGEPCYSYRKPMQKPLSAVGMLSKEGDQWKLEPVCLPLLHYDRSGKLRPELNKWKRVFAAEPVFRVFVGDTTQIRDGATWRYDTGSAGKPLPVRRLKWKDVDYVGFPALNWKPPGAPQTAVAQKLEQGAPKQAGLFRVLGCYEVAPNGDYLRKIPGNKKHELFLPYQAGRFTKLNVPAAVMERFQQLSDQMTRDSEGEPAPRPYEPKKTRPLRIPLRKGKDIEPSRLKPEPGDLVFFDVDEQAAQVTEIAYSSIWRGRVEADGKPANAWSFFAGVDKELTPFHADRTQVTLAERIFGFVEEKEGKEAPKGQRLKGRVRVSPARANSEIQEMPLKPLKELSSPKPPSPALYFRNPQGQNPYIPKSELKPVSHWPQGRKVYLHHPTAIEGDAKPWENTERNFVADRHVRIRPWAKGSKWRFEIRFDNLNDLELGLLLYALSPADTFRHKIGMGKPLGLGSVHMTISEVATVDRERRYSTDGWKAPRYSGNLKWEELRDVFRKGMIAEVRDALEELGNPTKLNKQIPITYPRVEGQTGEEDLYAWFVSNDQQKNKEEKVALQPVVIVDRKQSQGPRIQPLPRLRPPRT